ncbi:hypothetical protein FOC4_g10002560 [Fusarium odoratissimum]|uniref:Ras-GEF domain-containing protein n=1 Tax=Fusarium oxysporum f. sp. cubense (strain race 4) TaxID=2502994 RepID=N1S8B5_FUSC4|nr:hypothetical protein FOC4_g10002560 [Fusarium odoratissimum]
MQVFCAIQPKEPLGGRLDGLVALTSGLDNTSVSRLEQPYDALSLQAKESLHSLERTVGLSENRKALRASIKKGETSRNPDEKLINWEKYARIASIIKVLIESQRASDVTPDIELQSWLEKRP